MRRGPGYCENERRKTGEDVITAIDPWAIVAALLLLSVAAYIVQKWSGQRLMVAAAAVCVGIGFVAACFYPGLSSGWKLDQSLLQTAVISLAWPTLLTIIFLRYRAALIALIDALRVRIERGDTIEAGPRGIKLASVFHADGGTAVVPHPSLVVGEVGEDLKAKTLAEEQPKRAAPKKGDGENDLGIYWFIRRDD